MVALDRELVNTRSGWLGVLAILMSPPFGFLLGIIAARPVPESPATPPALGCQKLTSARSGFAARNLNQSQSVIPTQ